jgi:hypothetical protein
MITIVGVDPGLSGAFVSITGDRIDVLPMPVAGKEIDVAEIVSWFKKVVDDTVYVYIEAVHSMPKQGVSSSFKFGFVTGIVHGIVRTLDYPMFLVTPQAWKKEMLAGTDKTKQASIDFCRRAFPDVSLFRTPRSKTYDDGIADALLIAEYGRRKQLSL